MRPREYAMLASIIVLLTLLISPLAIAQFEGDDGPWFRTENSAERVVFERAPDAPTATTQPDPSPTAEPTATNEPEPTPTEHEHNVGVCGESHDTWHPPVIDGCATGHEHGDAPPQWVLDSGFAPAHTHAANTPNENVLSYKQTGFKGFTLADDGVEAYFILHIDSNPGGQSGRFHSYQAWARDAQGGISHWHGWLDFGQGNNTGSNLRTKCENQEIRPIISVNDEGCGPVEFESWYSRGGGSGNWSWDFGINLSANYYHGGDPTDPSTWVPTGGNNLTRRIEAAWYSFRSDERGTFYATQFGDVVSGPDDPICGTERSYGERSYTILCLEQYIAPTMTTVGFPDNSRQVTYPGDGVVLPN